MEKLWFYICFEKWGRDFSSLCCSHVGCARDAIYFSETDVKLQGALHPANDCRFSLLIVESCNARWGFQMVSSARSSLAWCCPLLNILPIYNPSKSKMLPQEHGDQYQPSLFWNCWHLDASNNCRMAALTQTADCLHPQDKCDQCCH